MPKLIYHDSDGVDKSFNLSADPVMIGRATECQIQTQDAMVSRRHARITWDGNYWVEDLGSSNGVYVGHEKVTRAPFRPGDIVTCGSLVLRMMPDTQPRMTPMPAPSADEFVETITNSALVVETPEAAVPAPVAPPPARERAATIATGAPDPRIAAELEAERQRREQAENALLSAAERTQQAEQKVEDLKREQQRLRQRCTDLEAEVERAMSVKPLPPVDDQEKIELQRQVRRLEADLELLRDAPPPEATRDETTRMALMAAQEERDQLKQRLEDLESDLERERVRLKSRITDLQQELEQALSAPKPAAAPSIDPAEKDKLIREIDRLTAELARTRTDVHDAEEVAAERDRLKSRVGSLESELQQQAERASADLAQAKSGAGRVEAEKNARLAAESERDQLRSRVTDLEHDLQRAKQPVEDPEKQQLQRQVEQLMGDLAALESSRAQSEGAAGADAQRAAELSDQLRRAHAERDGVKAEAQRAQDDLARAHDDAAKGQEQLQKAQDQARQAQDQARQAQDQAQKAQDHASHVEKQVADLEAQLKNAGAQEHAAGAKDEEIDRLQSQIKVLQRDLQDIEGELTRANQAASSAGADAGKVAELNDAVRKLTSERDTARADAQRADDQARAFEDMAKSAEEQARAAETQARTAEEQARAAEDQAHKAAAQLQAARSAPAPAAAAGGAPDPASGEAAVALGDALAELRSSLRAASDEATVLTAPADSVQVVADALSQATEQLENARANLRTLQKLLGVG
jgi:chromosome segregation ATPase